MKRPAPTFTATFVREGKAWPLDADGVRQLRLTLKRLLRSHGWRCTSVVPTGELEAIPVAQEIELDKKSA